MGVERLLALMSEAGAVAPQSAPDVYLAFSGAGVDISAWQAAEALRDAGLKVVLHCGGGSFKSQMRRADASGAAFAVIVGEAEAAAGQVAVKPLRQLGEQVSVSVAHAAQMVHAAQAACRTAHHN
jgi:histidyl-tRNA synthetase